MKSLIIAEKPSVASDIAKALGKCPRKDDYYEGDEFIVTSALGHLVELYMPEDIDKRLGYWRLEDLPIIPEKFQLKPIEKTADRFKEVAKLIARKDVATVVNACDAGREGELIFNYLFELSKAKKPVKRLWMSSMTPAGIREAFTRLRSQEQMQPLADAARCRSEADWLIGINGTRAITKRLFGARKGMMATVGRVQTPTLAILMNREREIRDFKPRAYSRFVARFAIAAGDYEGVYQRPDFKKGTDEHDRADRLWETAFAEKLAREVKVGAHGVISDESKRATQIAPRLYDLTTLQREANNRYGFPARRTLQIAQALYEQHKMITYPRTDSKALPEDYVPVVKATLANLGEQYQSVVAPVLSKDWVRPNKRIFNNAEVTDHFAIIPTNEVSRSLDEAEAKIYDLIVRRFIAIFYPVAQFDVTTRTTTVAGHPFKSEGKVLVDAGWLSVYGRTSADDDATKSLPPVLADDGKPPKGEVVNADIINEVTKPPPRYTEATLLSAMENAGKFVDDEDLADAMSERGLGTPATRAAIIEHLISEKYVAREQRELVPSTKAENVLEFLNTVKCEVLTSPALTGEWEFKLRKVEQGQTSRDTFMAEITDLTKTIVANTKGYNESPETAKRLAWNSFTDGQPMLEYDRKIAAQDGKLELYKTIGNRRFTEEELRTLAEQKSIGPFDNFVSAKSGKKFSAMLQLIADDAGTWRAKFVFDNALGGGTGAMTVNLDTLNPIGKHPRSGDPIYETPTSYVVRSKEAGQEKLSFRLARNLLGRDIPRDQYLKYLEVGRTDVLDKFWSRKTRRPFSAALVMKKDGSGFDFDFPPRPPKEPKAPKEKTLPSTLAARKATKAVSEPTDAANAASDGDEPSFEAAKPVKAAKAVKAVKEKKAPAKKSKK